MSVSVLAFAATSFQVAASCRMQSPLAPSSNHCITPLLRMMPPVRSKQIWLSQTEEPLPLLANIYLAAGMGTATLWAACAVTALSAHPNAAIHAVCGLRHNVLTILQALALPLPLLWAVVISLSSAAKVGWKRLGSATYRRLNLGLAAVSVWLVSAAAFMPAFACKYDMFPAPLKMAAVATHGLTAVLCLGAWGRTVACSPAPMSGHYVPRIVRGFVGSIASLPPKQASDDPDSRAGGDGRNEYALCAALFGYFSVLSVVSPFPLATVPAILGKRLSRAASGWTFLAAVVSYILKDATERDRINASTFVTLRRGLAIGASFHLGLIGLKLIGVDGGGLLLPGGGLWQVILWSTSSPCLVELHCERMSK